MDYPEEFHLDYEEHTKDLSEETIEIIRLSERARLFSSLRNLIQEKQNIDDSIAEYVLGWAYERLADN